MEITNILFAGVGGQGILTSSRVLALAAVHGGLDVKMSEVHGLAQRGGNVDTHDREIYIHGTGDQTSLGRPSSHGCIHLADDDLIALFDLLPSGTLVWIAER